MSTNTLTSPGQRYLKRLTVENEPTTRADAKFFARRPDRMHRTRLASLAEVEILRLLRPRDIINPDLRWYAIVKQIRPGFRARVFSAGLPDLDCDLPEATCALVYVRVASTRSVKVDDAGCNIITLKVVRS